MARAAGRGGWCPDLSSVPLRKRQHCRRDDFHQPWGGPSVHRQADRASSELRGAGSDRDGKCATYHRNARGTRNNKPLLPKFFQVINSSPGDLAPVFDAMLEKATRLCDTAFGVLWTFDGQFFHPTAVFGPKAFYRFLFHAGTKARSARYGPWRRTRRGRPILQVDDLAASDALTNKVYATNDGRRAYVDLGGRAARCPSHYRTDKALLGAVQVYRTEVRPFTDRQVALLQNFADSGRHCDGKRAPHYRDARGAGAADRHRRSSEV